MAPYSVSSVIYFGTLIYRKQSKLSLCNLQFFEPGSSVGILLTGYRLNSRHSIPSKGKRFICTL
jgi:hypothetical protein